MPRDDNYSLNEETNGEFVKEVNTSDNYGMNKKYDLEFLRKSRNSEKDNDSSKKEKTLRYFVRDEDIQHLLLYYMKLTMRLRRKTSDGGNEASDAESKNEYGASTESDSEEKTPSRKTSSAPPLLQCNHCSKFLRGIHSLKNHCMRKHGNHSEKNVLCDKCPNRFYTDFEFNRHYQTHYSVKNYLCHLCSKKFFQKSSLELHLRYHENDRRYQCETCRKKFFTNNHLKRHCLTHTDRRDFKCEPCDRSFRYKDHLRRHLQSVHIGIRSHCCRECDKSFMYLSQLKFHEQSHTGLPYKCKNCRQAFKKRILLKAHQRQCKG